MMTVELSVNKYLKMVIDKKGFFNSIKKRWKLNKFIKNLNKQTLNFYDLWEMAEFIKMAEIIFYYKNDINDELYSSRNYKDGENGFIINNNKYRLVVKLMAEDQIIILEKIYKPEEKKLSRHYRFKNGKWLMDFDACDQIIVDDLIYDIDKQLIKLLNYCWSYDKDYIFDSDIKNEYS